MPGLGTSFDWGLASFDIRNVVHISGGYELPVGRNKTYLAHAGKLTEAALGGWAVNYLVTLQGGQPIEISCPTATTSGTGCNALHVPGQDPKLGLHTVKDSTGKNNQFWFGNPAAFQQPCPLGFNGPITTSTLGASH